MRMVGSNVALSASYEPRRADSPQTPVRSWMAAALTSHAMAATSRTTHTAQSDAEKKFDPALLDWFIFLKTKNPDSDPTAAVEGVEEIRRLYKQAGPSYGAQAKPTKTHVVA
ncbi:MAG: hypothetical protein SF187_00465 [Deltaproteobacteria bacterium]|nr:hypothetical protein [Deltaproteobacteria bacterium]